MNNKEPIKAPKILPEIIGSFQVNNEQPDLVIQAPPQQVLPPDIIYNLIYG